MADGFSAQTVPISKSPSNLSLASVPSTSSNDKKVSSFSWRKVYDLAKPVWTDPARPKYMRTLIVARMAVLLLNPVLCIWITFPMGEMTSCLCNKDSEGFYEAVTTFVWLLILCCPVWALDFFMGEWLRMSWRQWMTKSLMKRYFRRDNFYHFLNKKGIDNPGMRICDDVSEFVCCLLLIVDKFAIQFFRALGFGFVLYTLAPMMLPWLFVYALVGTFGIVYGFGEKLATYNAGKFFLTANFRAGLLRSRENAESIAFYRAGNYENQWSNNRLDDLIANLFKLATWESWLRLFRNAYMWVAEGAPYIMLAPSFLAGEINFGTITQADEAFRSILRGTNMIIENLSHITALEATTNRIYEVIEALDEQEGLCTLDSKKRYTKKMKNEGYDMLRDPLMDMEGGMFREKSVGEMTGGEPDEITSGELVLDNVTVETPKRQVLVENLSLTVGKGKSLLIVGPSGVGKSSLLRAVCGLWKAKAGKIARPDHKNLMFLPQVPYIPDIPLERNTLKAQLCFPRTFANHSEEEMLAALSRVNLKHMTQGVGTWVTADWRNKLSGGEKQRLAMARLLLANPRMAFLDESTSALDDANEALLYKTMQLKGSSYVSVGHRQALYKYHTHVLEMSKDRTWTVKPSPYFQGFSG